VIRHETVTLRLVEVSTSIYTPVRLQVLPLTAKKQEENFKEKVPLWLLENCSPMRSQLALRLALLKIRSLK